MKDGQLDERFSDPSQSWDNLLLNRESSNSVWTRDEASLIETPFLIIQLNQWAKRHRGVSENHQEQNSQPSQPPPVPPPDTPPEGHGDVFLDGLLVD